MTAASEPLGVSQGVSVKWFKDPCFIESTGSGSGINSGSGSISGSGIAKWFKDPALDMLQSTYCTILSVKSLSYKYFRTQFSLTIIFMGQFLFLILSYTLNLIKYFIYTSFLWNKTKFSKK